MLICLILAATLLFAQLVRRRMNATYARYSAVPNRAGLHGAAVARHILDGIPIRTFTGRASTDRPIWRHLVA